ncbi:uncharacterized protein LOC122080651 [Macadamia integrifolia]|uniref:uncharacterized protein LOC122080651 n=1 Tax=Macadamia integrifolia TaxID=60698 RepID=UPI001C4FB751|nr:uncharacterized protein LOC122080651 [Macadamia integrifolia]
MGESAMTPQIKILLLFFLVLFILSPSSRVEGFKDGMKKVTHPIDEAMIIKLMKSRKLMEVTIMDYDDAGPNPKHDPRKGKPGGGGAKNP